MKIHKTIAAKLLLVIVLFGSLAYAQEYKLHVSSIRIPNQQEKTWYGRPLTSDFVVSWELYTLDDQGKPQLADIQVRSKISEYVVYLSPGDSTFSKAGKQVVISKEMATSGVDSARFAQNKVGSLRYYFRVEGKTDANTTIKSDTAWAVSGYLAASPSAQEKENIDNCPIALFWPVAELLGLFNIHNKVYDDSTALGKAAFDFLWYIGITGILIIIFRARPTLKLVRLFPLKPVTFFKVHMDKEFVFREKIAPRFLFIIEAWKHVALHTAKIRQNAHVEGSDDNDKINFNHFKEFGAPALEVLRALINFDPKPVDTKDSKKREADIKKFKTDIKKYFGKGGEFGDLISKPFLCSGHNCVELDWNEVEKELFDPKAKKLSDYPTVKVMAAGLDNHITNGYQWQHVSAEVDRAFENRVFSEIESMKEKSGLEWLWNLGAVAPLLGLFGTVTGITAVFQQIGSMDPATTQLELIKALSGGIFEALWTTIYGLVVGIPFMLVYYFMKDTLGWVNNRWQELFVHITEKL